MVAGELVPALLFWLTVAVAVYVYVLYPGLVAAAGRLLDRRVEAAPVTPSVSVIVAAYNEEDQIEATLAALLASDYPADRLDVLVASDGSTDDTEAVAARYAHRGVRVLSLPRRGKAHALNSAARRASGELLVFMDANSRPDPGALRALARNFADPEVGGVAGSTGYALPADGEAGGRGESLYWRYENWLKRAESRTGSVVSAHGGLYAVRRSLFRPLEDGAATDDFSISTSVVEQGYRLVFEPGARAVEAAPAGTGSVFRRRVRLTLRGLRSLMLRRRLLNPLRYGFYAVALLSHKGLRRLIPAGLPVLLATSVVLAVSAGSRFYLVAAVGQLLFYGLAGMGFLLRGSPVGARPIFYVPFYFTLSNAAALVGLYRLIGGERVVQWEPRGQGAAKVSA